MAAPVARAVDGWYREVVDIANDGSPLSMTSRNGVVSIVGTPYQAPMAFVSSGRRWDERELGAGTLVGSDWDDGGVPWLLLDGADGVSVKGGKDRAAENVAFGESRSHAHDITVDAKGVPHVCFSVEKAESAKDFIYAVRSETSKKAKSAWVLEHVSMPIDACRIVTTGDDVHIIVRGRFGIRVLSKNAGGSWRREELTSNPYASFAAARATTGAAMFAYVDGQTVHLLKVSSSGSQRSQRTLDVNGDVVGLELAIDGKERVHLAFRVSNKSIEADVFYLSDADAAATKPSLVAHDRPGPIAFALDENDVPHIAYVVQWPDSRKRQLVHARPTTADSAHPPGAYHRDEDTMLERCATMIASELGEAREPGKVRAAHRWCGHDSSLALPTLTELTARCDAQDANACLVAGLRVGKPPALISLEMANCRANPSAKPCFGSANLAGARVEWLSDGDDRAMALKYLEKACALGSKAACAVVGWNEQDPARSVEMFGRACSTELPTACAALLLKLRTAADRTQLSPVRTVLATACGASDKPDACNSLAYMEELGLGGKKRPADAIRHHVRACELGSVRSCARILTGSRPPPRAPARLDKEGFRDQMSTNCAELHDEIACLALATALETGWGVERDREGARDILEQACNDGHEQACARLRKRIPKSL